MIQGVVFDLGSTLMYWEGEGENIDAQSNAVLIEFLKANGVTVGEDFLPLFRAEREKGWKESEASELEQTVEEALHRALVQLGHSPLDGLLTHAVEQFFTPGEAYQRAYPGALETLQGLRQRGLRVGLISNADDDGLVQRAVVRLGFAPYLNPITSSAGLRWRKPNPSIFKHVADQWRLAPQQMAMVGDAPVYDILGAHRANMRGILVDRGEGHPWQAIPEKYADDPAIQPDATIGHLAEIMLAIEKL